VATHNLYSDNSAAIEAVLAYIRRAHRLSADDGDEFSSWARLRLLEDDCAILAKFQGLSKFRTFLTTVIHHLFLDWRNQQWGKWRPSAEARRLGPVAVELERLALRDKIDFEQAAQLLVSKGTAPSIAECDAIWSRLKQQGGREFVNVDDIDPVAVTPPSDPIESEERRRIVSKVLEALRRSLEQLPPGDSLIFKLRYWDRVTVARIAQMQGVEQKPLYRRFEQLLHQLRTAILGQGVTEAEMRRAFEGFGPDWDHFGSEDGK
jgi:RNA polymerase sigma factor (sigma-70 family)